MPRPKTKRSAEDEIQHLQKKIKIQKKIQAEEQRKSMSTSGTSVFITGECKNQGSGASCSSSDTDDGPLFTVKETPVHIIPPSVHKERQARPDRRSEPPAIFDAKAHSSTTEPRSNHSAGASRPTESLARTDSEDCVLFEEEKPIYHYTPNEPQPRPEKISEPHTKAQSPTSRLVKPGGSFDNSRKTPRTISESSQADDLDNNSVLDRNEALLDALGEEPSLTGEVIHPSLAQQWNNILQKGLPNGIKDKLLKEHDVPDNCKLLKAPTLNEEVSAAVEYRARNRDRMLESKHNQLGLGITAIGRAMTVLLSLGKNYKVNAIKHFNNGCRILLDLHSEETNSRRRLLTYDLKRSEVFRNLNIQELERDETLFGNKVLKMVRKQASARSRPLPLAHGGDPGLLNHARNEAHLMARDGEPSRNRQTYLRGG